MGTAPLLPRLVTIHPILVHVTLGVMPVIVVAYAISAVRRSARWSFAGDVALWICAIVTIATAAFGLTSNALLAWPGGLGVWRWAHLGFAAGTSILLTGVAVWRFRANRRGELAGGGALAGAIVVALLFWVTGWIGGEVLVYRAGMAVEGAGLGALSPVARGRGSGSPPRDLQDAMGRMRGSWALASTTFDQMLVERPTDSAYDRIAKSAIDLQEMASWLSTEGQRELREHAQHDPDARVNDGTDPHASDPPGGLPPEESGATAARALQEHANELARAARARDWGGVTRSLSAVTSVCAECHRALRWRAHSED